MTKRRDRNRKARRRKRVYRVYRVYWSDAEEHAVARIIAARILQAAQTEREEPNRETLRTRGVRRRANTQHL